MLGHLQIPWAQLSLADDRLHSYDEMAAVAGVPVDGETPVAVGYERLSPGRWYWHWHDARGLQARIANETGECIAWPPQQFPDAVGFPLNLPPLSYL